MNVKLPTEHHLEFFSLKGGCTGLSESTLVKMPHCWKSHALAHICYFQPCSLTFHQEQEEKIIQNLRTFTKFVIYRGSYISAHVLLNLLGDLRKKDKMRGLFRKRAFYLFFATRLINSIIQEHEC